MTPGSYDLVIYKGDTYRWKFLLWDDAAKTDPTDLTGVTVKAEIRDKPGGAALYTALACTVTVPNTIDMVLSHTASASLPVKGAWDLQLTYPSGDVATVLAGNVTATLDVTDTTVSELAAVSLAAVR